MARADQQTVRLSGAFLRLAGLSVAVVVVAAAIGFFPTQALAGRAGAKGMLAGLGIALAATLVGLVPPLLTLRAGPRARVGALLTGMALRFILTLGLLLAGVLSGRLPRVPLAVWAVIGYLLLVAVDTAGVVWLNKRGLRA